MVAEDKNTPTASHADARRTSAAASALAPLPDHRNVDTAWWQELWRRHAHITTPLRQRGLECDIEFGLSAYIVRVSLPDDSYLIIGPPQEPSCDRPPGDPQGWIVTRQHPDEQALFEVIYDSAPSADPRAPERPEARHGGNATPLIEAIDQRLIQLGLLPAPSSSTASALLSAATPTLRPPKTLDVSDNADRTSVYVYGNALLALTDRLNATESHADAAALLHQVLDPTSGLLERLGEFFEAAGEKAKEAEQDDGFDLHYDLEDAAATLRSLGEGLHTAVDRMRALAPARQTTSAALPSGPSPGLPTSRGPRARTR
ncbi:hypothetical protein GCM10019016_078550 [Streptomyces prasinosporus]|uniref:Uncharacterized protein n=1 Tax=Streptomyces prasinosporus TaxID=68256 RepID=A0ABP6TZC6_9ACTN|nr:MULTISPECIES: hypothetical protein [Streptomyces]GHB93461.1 hypothetical protein GCM10010332_19220 [Streptomyces albogriseolus]